MKYKTPLLLAALCASMTFAGCRANTSVPESSAKLMTVGKTTFTKGDEYNVFKEISGTNGVLSIANRKIADKEIGVTDEIKEEAQNTLDTYTAVDGFEDQLKENGYDSAEDFINKVLIPNIQSTKLTEKYFTDAKEEIIQEFDPVKAFIIETDSEDNANKALEALKKAKTPERSARSTPRPTPPIPEANRSFPRRTAAFRKRSATPFSTPAKTACSIRSSPATRRPTM